MKFRKTLLSNVLELPAYWKACRRARGNMNVQVEKIFFGQNHRQYLLRLTTAQSKPDKVAFYFHGGAWTFGEPATFIPAAIPWLESGFTVVLPSYRRPPKVGLNRIITDCRSALKSVAPGVETTHLHLGGISAGAHLAAVLALHPEWWRMAGWPIIPQKALLCAGPLKLSDLWPTTLFRRYAHLDPWRLLSEKSPELKWQLLHGTADVMVAQQHSIQFYQKLKMLGQRATLLSIPNGTHLDAGRWMFDGVGAVEVNVFIKE